MGREISDTSLSKRAPSLAKLLHPEVPVVHLAAVGFQADAARLGDLERRFEHLAVARAVGDLALHDDDDLVPLLGLVLLELLVGAGDQVVADLELRLGAAESG